MQIYATIASHSKTCNFIFLTLNLLNSENGHVSISFWTIPFIYYKVSRWIANNARYDKTARVYRWIANNACYYKTARTSMLILVCTTGTKDLSCTIFLPVGYSNNHLFLLMSMVSLMLYLVPLPDILLFILFQSHQCTCKDKFIKNIYIVLNYVIWI